MGEYWKSLPRKFCEACKCWFADNKASIQFHEQGKKHKENAAKRIQDIQKRGIKEAKKQKELEDDMAKIEKAALAAYERDLKRIDGGLEPEPAKLKDPVSSVKLKEPKSKDIKSSLETVQKKIESKLAASKVWYEAETDGHKYYYNSETSESQWEPPKEGFVSITEQNEIADRATKAENDSSDDSLCSFGPQPKANPYGHWVTIEKEEPVEYDLQLPEKSENIVEAVIPLHKEEKSMKFKEKVVGQLTDVDPSEVTFKKRKFAGSSRKNARQRTTDDD